MDGIRPQHRVFRPWWAPDLGVLGEAVRETRAGRWANKSTFYGLRIEAREYAETIQKAPEGGKAVALLPLRAYPRVPGVVGGFSRHQALGEANQILKTREKSGENRAQNAPKKCEKSKCGKWRTREATSFFHLPPLKFPGNCR